MKYSKEEIQRKWVKIIAKAWLDEGFKKRLVSHPKEVCKEFGLELPKDIQFEVIQETKKKQYLLLPAKPEENLTEEELNQAAAGFTYHSHGCLTT